MKKSIDINNDILIADALIKLAAIENLLVSKGIFSKEEFQKETQIVADNIVKIILQKSQDSNESGGKN